MSDSFAKTPSTKDLSIGNMYHPVQESQILSNSLSLDTNEYDLLKLSYASIVLVFHIASLLIKVLKKDFRKSNVGQTFHVTKAFGMKKFNKKHSIKSFENLISRMFSKMLDNPNGFSRFYTNMAKNIFQNFDFWSKMPKA
jgi:hypothetical protein